LFIKLGPFRASSAFSLLGLFNNKSGPSFHVYVYSSILLLLSFMTFNNSIVCIYHRLFSRSFLYCRHLDGFSFSPMQTVMDIFSHTSLCSCSSIAVVYFLRIIWPKTVLIRNCEKYCLNTLPVYIPTERAVCNRRIRE